MSTFESYDRMTGVSKYTERRGGERSRGEKGGEKGSKGLVSTFESYDGTTGEQVCIEERGEGGREERR